MDSIQAPISNEPVSQFPRRGIHENFQIGRDLHMTQQVRVVTLDDEGNPLKAKILADEMIPADRKQAMLARYADQIVTRTTDGAFVNEAGQVVEATVKGAISQRDYFQAITIGDLKKKGMTVNDKTPVTSLIYALVQGEIINIDNRGGL